MSSKTEVMSLIVYWPLFTTIIALASGLLGYFFRNRADRKRLYVVFIEECILNYSMLTACFPEQIDKNNLIPTIRALYSADLADAFIEHNYAKLNLLLPWQIHDIVTTYWIIKQIKNEVAQWSELLHKRRNKEESSKFGVMSGALLAKFGQLWGNVKSILEKTKRGRVAIETYEKSRGHSVDVMRAIRVARDLDPSS